MPVQLAPQGDWQTGEGTRECSRRVSGGKMRKKWALQQLPLQTDYSSLISTQKRSERGKGKKEKGGKGRERKSRGEGERKRQKGGGKKDLIHVSFCGCPWIEPTSASATDGNREQQGGGEAIGHLHKNRGPWSTEEMLIYSNGSSVIPDHSIT